MTRTKIAKSDGGGYELGSCSGGNECEKKACTANMDGELMKVFLHRSFGA